MTTSTWELETDPSPWWFGLVAGVVNIAIGTLLLVNPGKTAVLLAWVLGCYWFAQGALMLVGIFLDRSAWGWKLLVGLLGIVAGLAAVRYPIAGAVAIPAVVVLLVGIQGLIVGCLLVVMAFRGAGWGTGILGALSVLFGLTLALNYANLATVLVAIWVAAILALAGGVVQIIQALRQR